MSKVSVLKWVSSYSGTIFYNVPSGPQMSFIRQLNVTNELQIQRGTLAEEINERV
jgi:hypothetical protein